MVNPLVLLMGAAAGGLTGFCFGVPGLAGYALGVLVTSVAIRLSD